jgi:hypothetical protein
MDEQRPDHAARGASAAPAADRLPRTIILRDVVVFQAKLFVDGLRDLLLVPVSLIAAVVDVLAPGKNTGQHFYEVVRFGRRTERWIGLFSAADHLDDRPHEPMPDTIDDIVARVEGRLKEQYTQRKPGPRTPP